MLKVNRLPEQVALLDGKQVNPISSINNSMIKEFLVAYIDTDAVIDGRVSNLMGATDFTVSSTGRTYVPIEAGATLVLNKPIYDRDTISILVSPSRGRGIRTADICLYQGNRRLFLLDNRINHNYDIHPLPPGNYLASYSGFPLFNKYIKIAGDFEVTSNKAKYVGKGTLILPFDQPVEMRLNSVSSLSFFTYKEIEDEGNTEGVCLLI